MRKQCSILTAVSIPILWSLSAAHAGDKGFFNGKDLEGWEGLLTHWSVKDGAIVGTTQPKGNNFNTFLCTKRSYKDFELKFQVKLTGKGANSGVQIRSILKDREKFVVWGPQCDMGQQYWGTLFGEHFGGKKEGDHSTLKAADPKLVKKIVKEEEFNDYHIKCVGKHVTIKLNGETTVDDDIPNLPDEGIIALQLHSGGPMEATFRNIEFREIKAEGKINVHGTVSWGIKPLAGAVIEFTDDKGNKASAKTDDNGNYTVKIASAGKQRVAVSLQKDNKELLPAAYDAKSILVVDIPGEGGTFNFVLPSK